jgi:hypothetical protein
MRSCPPAVWCACVVAVVALTTADAGAQTPGPGPQGKVVAVTGKVEHTAAEREAWNRRLAAHGEQSVGRDDRLAEADAAQAPHRGIPPALFFRRRVQREQVSMVARRSVRVRRRHEGVATHVHGPIACDRHGFARTAASQSELPFPTTGCGLERVETVVLAHDVNEPGAGGDRRPLRGRWTTPQFLARGERQRYQRVTHGRDDGVAGDCRRSRDKRVAVRGSGGTRCPLHLAGQRVDGQQTASIRRVAAQDRRAREGRGSPIPETGVHGELLRRSGPERAERRRARLRQRQHRTGRGDDDRAASATCLIQ